MQCVPYLHPPPLFSKTHPPNILLIASLTKTLSESGTRNLDSNSIPISEPIVNHILRKSYLDPSQKLEFFRWCCSLRPKFEHTPGTYSHMFRTLCRAGFLEEIPNLLNSMKDDGVVVGSETFQSLLDAFIRSGKFDYAFQILDHMEELGTSLNPSVYDTVIVALVKKKQVGLAMSIFLKLLEGFNGAVDGNGNPNSVVGSLPGSIACNALLVALRKADKRDEFNRVLEKLREKKGFGLDAWGYNICIHAFGCWGDLATSLRLYKEMKEKSLAFGLSGPDLCTYNSLIHVLCVVGKVKDALVVWEDLKVSGHEPDAFTYRILVQGCAKSYRIDDAVIIFNEMHINGFAPDTIVYNSLLDGLFKARKITEACQLFEQMVQDGVRASCWTYNIVINGLFRNGRPEAGYTLFCDLKKKGQFVDAVTYSIVVLQLCKEGLLEETLKLVEEMEARGLVVDLVTITTLLIGFYKEGKSDWTERLMKHIRDGNLMLHVLKWKANMEASMKNPAKKREDYSSLFPTEGNFSDFMNLVSNAVESIGSEEGQGSNEDISSGETDQWSSSPYMDQLADQLKPNERSSQLFSLKRGQRVREKGSDSFDVNMMNTYLSIFLSKGKLNLACKLFEIFTEMGVNPVNYTYNSIMSSFVKKGYFNEAWSVLNEMEEKICPADIATYNLIIQGLGKMGRADIASSVLDKLMKHGGFLDIVMYNTLINALGKAARVDDASKLFEQMRTNGINPDVVTFNTLIEVHTKAGRLKDAYKFLKMMLDEGCLPNHVTDTILDNLGKEIDNLRYKKASFVRDDNDDSS